MSPADIKRESGSILEMWELIQLEANNLWPSNSDAHCPITAVTEEDMAFLWGLQIDILVFKGSQEQLSNYFGIMNGMLSFFFLIFFKILQQQQWNCSAESVVATVNYNMGPIWA